MSSRSRTFDLRWPLGVLCFSAVNTLFTTKHPNIEQMKPRFHFRFRFFPKQLMIQNRTIKI
jgi:hypothetical protein